MAIDNFERLLRDEQRALEKACIALPLGDSYRHAEMRGKHAGLDHALKLYREAIRADMDGEAA